MAGESFDDVRVRFQALADRFQLDKEGVSPFDAHRLDNASVGASHGEICAVRFLLNLWNSSATWQAGRFDVFDAATIWDDEKRAAFADWMRNPFWP